MKKESQETVINTAVVPTSSSSINNHIMHTPISVGVPSLLPHNSFVIPAASLPYIQSPLHQTMELLANRLTSTDEYNAALYATLVEQWTQYYTNHPHEIFHHLQRNQFEQEAMMNQSAGDLLRQQIPLGTQHII